MKAILKSRSEPGLWLDQVDEPAPGPGDVLIRIRQAAICGTDDRAVQLPDMQRWSEFTSGAFRLRSLPGDHFFPLNRMPEILGIALWEALEN